MSLSTDLKYLKGIGDARSKMFAKELDLHTFRDLLFYFPYRHIDRSKFYKIRELREDMPYVQLIGRFLAFTEEGEGVKRRLKATFSDGSRMMEVTWFSKIDYIRNSYSPGKIYVLFGKPKIYREQFSMVHPEVEEYDSQKPLKGFEGIYTITDTMRKRGFSTRIVRRAIDNLLEHTYFKTMPETLPRCVIDRFRLMPIKEALTEMHHPSTPEKLALAQRRLKFEELFYLQLNILKYSRSRNLKIKGFVFSHIGDYFNNYFSNHIPFELTDAQKRVLKEIRKDMRTGHQMNRLLQGDVGSGKTMVAFMTMLIAIDNGFQAAIIAPTEILASQHYETISKWGEKIGLKVGLLTGSSGTKKRREIDEQLQSGEMQMIVGTHALLEDRVAFKNLGIAVIDEQHRFGVAQRAKMWIKNETPPHVLVMTATPIPRTLAMTVYGDLEVSVIDELPPGRKPITTRLYFDNNKLEMERLMASQLKLGRQIYVVYPLIKENEKLSLKSLEQGYEYICREFSDYKVSCVHGRMKPSEKDYQMAQFVSGESRIMVATTVIEVGVNVPNATVMVIHNAERFGLSQLHQLRGRVGRGGDVSYCLLVTKHNIASDTRKRLEVMIATTDGFLVAEADMKQRGPGDLEGTQQSGIAFKLKIANLCTDGKILSAAREMAGKILDANPGIGVSSDNVEIDKSLILNNTDINLILKELYERRDNNAGWSQIS